MRRRLGEFALFLVVGLASAGIDAGGFVLLTWVGVDPIIASPIGFVVSVLINFFANRLLVFRVAARRGQMVKYLSLVAVNVLLSSVLVALGIAVGLEPLWAKVLSIGIIAVWNYVLLRRWVFSEDEKEAS